MQKDLEQNGGILNSTDPEKMKAVGMRLAAAGHPGGAGTHQRRGEDRTETGR
jgi:hypothetical protein